MPVVDPDLPKESANRDVNEYTRAIASGKKFISKEIDADIEEQKENSETVNSPFFMALSKEEIIEAKK